MAISKGFARLLQANPKQISGVRKFVDLKYDGVICRGFNQMGIPGKTDCFPKGPCCDWDELIKSDLAKTIHVDMPESIRPGKVRVRGARSGRQVRHAGKETEGDDTQNEDSCEEGEVFDMN